MKRVIALSLPAAIAAVFFVALQWIGDDPVAPADSPVRTEPVAKAGIEEPVVARRRDDPRASVARMRTPRTASESSVETPDGWPGARVLARIDSGPRRKGSLSRTWLIQPVGLPFPVRLEESLERDPASGELRVTGSQAMVGNRILVGFEQDRLAAVAAAAVAAGARLDPHPTAPGLAYLRFADAGIDTVPEALRHWGRADGLRYAEPDYIVHALATTPDDPRFNELWGLDNTGQSGGQADADIDAPEGWDIRHDASGVIVGIIDSGIRATHQDLAANMWVNAGEVPGNGVDDDGNGYIDDIHGINAITGSGNATDDNSHGTHVAGTVGAVGNNGTGVAGVAWSTQLVALKFLSAGGSGATSDAIECIDYAIAAGAHVLNNSWGGGGFSLSLEDAVGRAESAGVVFVAAAGNAGSDNDRLPAFPASYENPVVVSVASATRSGTRSGFSNTGEQAVDIFAPGSAVLSVGYASDSAYATLSGTSMATPHVAGLVALIAAQFPGDSAVDWINRLYAGGEERPGFEGLVRTGRMANLAGALNTPAVAVQYPEITAPLLERFLGEGESFDLIVEAGGDPPLNYAWFRDGVLLPEETGPTLTRESAVADDSGEYRVVVSNEAGRVTSTAQVDIGVPDAILADALDNPGIGFVTVGDASWSADSEVSRIGDRSAGSGDIGDSQVSRLVASLEGPGTISFWWQVSSEVGYDYLQFLVDGVSRAAISGSVGWTERTFELTEGSHAIEWFYTKDGSVSSGADRGWVDGVMFTVNGVTPPAILRGPRNLAVLVGDDASFDAEVVGSEPLEYAWFRNDQLIISQDSPELKLKEVTTGDAAEYRVRVSNDAGSRTSAPARLQVHGGVQAPQIVVDPKPVVVNVGESVRFTVEVEGTSPFQFLWKKDAVLVFDTYRPVLDIGSVTLGDAGDYRVTVVNREGSATSASATLTVLDASLAPAITDQPVDQEAFSGDRITFAVAASGAPELSYQWRFDGDPLAGEVGDKLILDPVTAVNAGAYQVVVSNPFGIAESRPAALGILTEHPDLADGVETDGLLRWGTRGAADWFLQTADSYDGVDALRSGDVADEQNSRLVTFIDGPAFLTFRWKVSSEDGWDFLRFFVDGELWGEISGETEWLERTALLDAGSHRVEWAFEKDQFVSGGQDAGWLDAVSLIFPDVEAPVIVRQPVSRAVSVGDAASFTVEAFGTEPLAYVWKRGDAEVAAGPEFVISEAQAADAGSYFVEVSNGLGMAQSVPFRLGVFGDDPFGQALDFSGPTWESDGDASWNAQIADTSDGVDAAASGSIFDNQQSTLRTFLPGPAEFSFAWRASSEDEYDFLDLHLNGESSPSASLAGNTAWYRQFVTLGAGLNTIEWRYVKDNIISLHRDRVYVDALREDGFARMVNEALGWNLLPWSGDGTSWFAQSVQRIEGSTALESGPLSFGRSSSLRTTLYGPGELRFMWRLESPEATSRVRFALDDTTTRSLSGVVDWREETIVLGEGRHSVEWIVDRIGATVEPGIDAAWLDRLVYRSDVIELWRASTFADNPDNPEISADPDRDGLDNLTEYALGTDPLDGSHGGLLREETVVVDDRHYLQLVVRMRKNDSTVALIPEVATDLAANQWETVDGRIIETGRATVDAAFDEVTLRDTVPLGAGETRFVRLRAVRVE